MKRLCVVVLLLVTVPSGWPAGTAEAGKEKSDACATCHGADGKAPINTIPKLAGQHAAYLLYALKAYKAGQRKGSQAGLMLPVAMTLSDQDMEDLAAYYASLQP